MAAVKAQNRQSVAFWHFDSAESRFLRTVGPSGGGGHVSAIERLKIRMNFIWFAASLAILCPPGVPSSYLPDDFWKLVREFGRVSWWDFKFTPRPLFVGLVLLPSWSRLVLAYTSNPSRTRFSSPGPFPVPFPSSIRAISGVRGLPGGDP